MSSEIACIYVCKADKEGFHIVRYPKCQLLNDCFAKLVLHFTSLRDERDMQGTLFGKAFYDIVYESTHAFSQKELLTFIGRRQYPSASCRSNRKIGREEMHGTTKRDIAE